jgi:hypothetical protein
MAMAVCTMGMGCGQLRPRETAHAVTDGRDLAETKLVDEVCDVVRVGSNRIRSVRLVALPVASQVYGHNPMPLGKMLVGDAARMSRIDFLLRSNGIELLR